MVKEWEGSGPIKWIYGLVALGFGIFLTLILNSFAGKIEDLDAARRQAEQNIVGLKEIVKQVDELVRMTRAEQVDRTFKLADMGNKIALVDNKLTLLDDRYKTISERILAINGRLDKMGGKTEQKLDKRMYNSGDTDL